MPTFLQPVDVPERCFLHEVLLWVAFGRLPVAVYTDKGHDIRESQELGDIGGYAIDFIGSSSFSEEETERAGIPPDPSWQLLLEGKSDLPVVQYDNLLEYDLEDADRSRLLVERDEAKKFEADYAAWTPHYERAIEYPASRIFVALRNGSLTAKGRRLEGPDIRQAFDSLDEQGRDIFEVEYTEIPRSFWSLQGIDFDASAASNGQLHYCHVSCLTNEMLSVFPGDPSEVNGVHRVGDAFVLRERQKVSRTSVALGRPAYPWDRFHVEVAVLLQRKELPSKKEAAIAHFQSWFQRELGLRPSRAAIGDKLKPYYDRFVKAGGQKIS
jgi:hypothetical protein